MLSTLIFRSLFFIVLLICSIPGFVLNLPIAGTAKILSQYEAKKAKEGSLDGDSDQRWRHQGQG